MTEILYITSTSSILDRINRLDQIMLKLETQLINVHAGNSDVKSYMLDDGQTKITSEYNSIESIAKAIDALDKKREQLINQLNGRCITLRDVRGLR